jgi:hypothetical protein
MLELRIEQAMPQAHQQDQAEDRLYGVKTSPTKLPQELKDLKNRREKLKQAMAKIQEIEQVRTDKPLSSEVELVRLS